MEIASYLDAIRRDSTALAAAGTAGLDAAVPSCPGWDVGHLVGHVAQVHRWFTLLLQSAPGEQVRFRDVPPPPQDEAVVAWLDEAAGGVLAALERTDPDMEVQTWSGPQVARWVFRRVAQETAMHRWDAQAATGEPSPIATELAVDGIDEVLEVFAPAVPAEGLSGDGQTIHLHAADTDGEWLLTFTPTGLTWDRSHAKADVAARGAASDLLLLLWNRAGTESLDVYGDEPVLARWKQGFSI